jgi:hypothetical protein
MGPDEVEKRQAGGYPGEDGEHFAGETPVHGDEPGDGHNGEQGGIEIRENACNHEVQLSFQPIEKSAEGSNPPLQDATPLGVERMLMQPEVLPTISQTERVSQALHMGKAQQFELGGRSIELSGRRQDRTLESQLSDLLQTR